ncbi:methyltransferase [Nocardia australiensis]|uniref:methyltransferase n=1 Tax=Nocardia australiensis TaxID=2887191 RepID=UPI001D14B13F|nr:methyltransferase [Nocardia australiensis]
MAKLTKAEEKLHAEALALVDLERDLSEVEKWFVLEHFQEASTATNSTHGAFFTPDGLARDFAIEVPDSAARIIDFGAGIGRLSIGCRNQFGSRWNSDPDREFVCIERNSAYVRIGRKLLPEAVWIEGDVLDVLDMGLGHFDVAIGNPPFGGIKRSKDALGYKGRKFEYHVIALASQLADYGVFIIPQMSAPFRYSGRPYYEGDCGDREYRKFSDVTGIVLNANCGIDTSSYAGDWHGVSPAVEIVTVDFEECRSAAAHEEETETAVHPVPMKVIDVQLPEPDVVPSESGEQYMFQLGEAQVDDRGEPVPCHADVLLAIANEVS